MIALFADPVDGPASDEREAEQEEEERKAFFHTTTDLAVVRRFAMKARRLRPN